MKYFIAAVALLFLAACGGGTTTSCSAGFDANGNPTNSCVDSGG